NTIGKPGKSNHKPASLYDLGLSGQGPTRLRLASGQILIGTHDETLTVAVRVHNPDRATLAIKRGDVAVAPAGFVGIVGDDFPRSHRHGVLLIVQHRLRCALAEFKLCAHFL